MNQQNQRQKLYALLGDLPARERSISVELIAQEERKGYILEKLLFDLNGQEAVPAYFVKPLVCDEPLPAVLYHHAHGGNYQLGKDELLQGRSALQNPPYAEALMAQGYAALCIDMWCFGERSQRSELTTFKEMLWQGQVLWGMMVYDSLKALDYLVSRPDIDETKIATLGLSMGSTMAWWLAALDMRIKVCIDLCCLTDFEDLIATNGLDKHGIYYYVPSLINHFSTSAINELIVPRPHLSLVGNQDPLTPKAGVNRIDAALKKAYQTANADSAWQLRRYEVGHQETAEMRLEVMAFLEQWL